MLKIIGIAIAALLAVVLGLAAVQPDTFRVQRTATIQAPPEKIAALIDDFHNWRSWSPYEKLDPAMSRTYSGAANGEGAVYAWHSEEKAGAGRMEIMDASPRHVTIQLDFVKPFETHNIAEFTLEPRGDSTQVTWAMRGPNPYVAKVMGVFLSMDDIVGKDFEAGLANLKAVAESKAT